MKAPGPFRATSRIESLIAAMVELTRRHDASSLHITFPEEDEWRRCGAAG